MKRLLFLIPIIMFTACIAITPGSNAAAGTTQPTISTFNASPSPVSPGGTSTLTWNVSGATTVTIDQGIGNVALSGNRAVTPTASTIYTLTATNAAGKIATVTTQVMVSAISTPPAAPEQTPPLPSTPAPTPSLPTEDKPDLLIEDISRSGDNIYYKIRNQGTATSGASISVLSVDGVIKAYDSVGPLNAGAISNRSFATYTYSCTGASDTIAVSADKDNVVVESNEGNNADSVSWTCLVVLPMPSFPLVPLGKPDLVITDIWESGDRIHYKIKNQGTVASVASTSVLYISAPIDSDSVPSIATGATVERQFAFVFSCIFPTAKAVQVRADTGNTNTESDEGNNIRSENITCH